MGIDVRKLLQKGVEVAQMVEIIRDIVPSGRKNRPGRKNTDEYITIHNTGNAGKGANAKSHAAYVKGDAAAASSVSWHYTVDDKNIYQHIPDDEIAWHCGDGGSGPGNNKSIGIEICMNSDGSLNIATDNAAELAANLCKKYNIPIENIKQHNHWSGKNCPQMIRQGKPYDWTTFILKVQEHLNNLNVPIKTENFYVSMGDFVIRTDADMFQDLVRRAGFDPYIIMSDGIFIVCVGRGINKEEAEDILTQISSREFVRSFIVEGLPQYP